MNGRKWTDKERRIIRRDAKKGAAHIAKIIDRSVGAVQAEAAVMRVSLWTEARQKNTFSENDRRAMETVKFYRQNMWGATNA